MGSARALLPGDRHRAFKWLLESKIERSIENLRIFFLARRLKILRFLGGVPRDQFWTDLDTFGSILARSHIFPSLLVLLTPNTVTWMENSSRSRPCGTFQEKIHQRIHESVDGYRLVISVENRTVRLQFPSNSATRLFKSSFCAVGAKCTVS